MVVQKGVPRPHSGTRAPQAAAGKNKLATMARMHRRRTRDPQDSQFSASTGVLNPTGGMNYGVCMKCKARLVVPATGLISPHVKS